MTMVVRAKKRIAVGTHSHGEHVVSPYAHADEADSDSGTDHDGITENGFARKDRDDFRGKGERPE